MFEIVLGSLAAAWAAEYAAGAARQQDDAADADARPHYRPVASACTSCGAPLSMGLLCSYCGSQHQMRVEAEA